MKKTFKKLTALAMAFTLLCAGSTISKAIAPKSVKTLTASAASSNDAKNGISFLGWLGELFDPFWGGFNAWTKTANAANNLIDKATERYDFLSDVANGKY